MRHFAIIGALALLLSAGAVQADMIVDFGGDYVSAETVLADGKQTLGGADGTFSTISNGVLKLKDVSGADQFDFDDGGNADAMITWAAEDVAGGGAGMVFDFTGLGASDIMVSVLSSISVPRMRVVVEVAGVFYASSRAKTNGTPKNYSRGDIEGQAIDFQKVNLGDLTLDSSTTISFAELTSVESVGFIVTGDYDRDVNGFEAFGAIVPEPATLTLLGLGGLAFLRRRRA